MPVKPMVFVVPCIAIACGLSACNTTDTRPSAITPSSSSQPHTELEPPPKPPPEIVFTNPGVTSYGRVQIIVRDSSSERALNIRCKLPQSIDHELRFAVGPDLEITLGLNEHARWTFGPVFFGPAPPGSHPEEREQARHGTLVCFPGNNPGEISVTLNDLRFQDTTMPHLGPLTVQHDNPIPP